MKTYHLLSLLFAALLIATAASSQNIQTATIEWNCTSTLELSTGTLTNENTKVVSAPDRITWYNANGDTTLASTIIASVGSWNNVTANGSIEVRVSSDTQQGLVEFKRSGGTMIIRIHIGFENPPIVFELVVANLHVL